MLWLKTTCTLLSWIIKFILNLLNRSSVDQWQNISRYIRPANRLRTLIKHTVLLQTLYLQTTESRVAPASLWLDDKLKTKSSSTNEVSSFCSTCSCPIKEPDPDDWMCTSKNEASTSPEFSGVSAGYGVLAISGVFGSGEVLSENCNEN